MRNYYLDGVMGVAVGDALGLPVQFMDRREIANDPVKEMRRCDLFWSPAGTWSDDTAMTVAMLDSIRKLDHIDAENIMQNFIKWLDDAEYTACDRTIDVGNTCFEGIKRYEKEHDIKTCGKTGEHANGNGSLMRTIPICIFYAEKVQAGKATVDEAIEQIHTVSALTHNHIRACMACGLYFFCTMSIMYGEGTLIERLQKGMDEGFKFYGADEENNFELTHYGQFMELTEFREFPEDMIKSTGYVVDSFEAAIWSLITTESYRDAIIKAANLGDDTDTVAAIAGGLAGLYYGYENIPSEWLDALQKREWLEEICNLPV